MTLTNLTNKELVRQLRDKPDLTETELELLQRLVMALDEVDALTSEMGDATQRLEIGRGAAPARHGHHA